MAKNRMIRRVFTGLFVVGVSVGTALPTAAEAQSSQCHVANSDYVPVYKEIDGTLHISASKGALEVIERLLKCGREFRRLQ